MKNPNGTNNPKTKIKTNTRATEQKAKTTPTPKNLDPRQHISLLHFLLHHFSHQINQMAAT
jgi:hypothetical protein